MQNLSDLRKEYTREILNEESVSKNPVAQFQKWFDEALAAQVPEPTAMNLATVTEKGTPTSRIVLLKGLENEHFIFYTNYQSDKGRELEKKSWLCSFILLARAGAAGTDRRNCIARRREVI